MSSIKELDFFVEELNWHRGVRWYERQFARVSPGALAVGEASANYTKYPRYQGVPARISSLLPHAKLVYVVRDPIERMRSHYEHGVAIGWERQPIERALFENPAYLTASLYSMQIEQYLNHFPSSHLLVITSEDLRHSRKATMRVVYEFLDVDHTYVSPQLGREFYKSEGRSSYSPAVAALRSVLKKRFPPSKRAKELVDSLVMWRRPSFARNFPRRSDSSATPGSTWLRAVMSDEVRCRLEATVCEDVSRLYAYVSGDFDGWGIA